MFYDYRYYELTLHLLLAIILQYPNELNDKNYYFYPQHIPFATGIEPEFVQAEVQSSGFNVNGFTNFSNSSSEHGLHPEIKFSLN